MLAPVDGDRRKAAPAPARPVPPATRPTPENSGSAQHPVQPTHASPAAQHGATHHNVVHQPQHVSKAPAPFSHATPFFKRPESPLALSKTTPYFKGQKPSFVTQFGPIYLNPRTHPSHGGGGDPVLQALGWLGHESAHVSRGTGSILGKTAASVYHHDARYLKLAGREAVHDPNLVGALATAALFVPGLDVPAIAYLATAATVYGTAKDIHDRNLRALPLDVASLGVGRLANLRKDLELLRTARSATERARVAELSREIRSNPRPTPKEVQSELEHAIRFARMDRAAARTNRADVVKLHLLTEILAGIGIFDAHEGHR